MFKQLKIYYVLIAFPFVLLLAGAMFFFNAIKLTILRNPHPQINYTIFVIILVGGVFIIINARRLVREARVLVEFCGAIHAKWDSLALQELANGYIGDIACLLQMIAASGGRAISHQEQVALEHELANARTRLNRRNALPQYLTGLLVGMGLLGTFIGLLATLSDISALISSFGELDVKNVDPIMVFRTMIDRMKAPMQSMGIAFSASMFGLLGSIILGLMMVGIRRLQGDIFSLLSSELAHHVEVALSYDGGATAGGEGRNGDEYKVLIRIEERLAEAARLQQRKLASEIEDFQQQRADMLRALNEQIESNNNFRTELQQLGRQLGTLCHVFEKGNGEIFTQISELTVNLSGNAKESQKLLAQQVEEQQRLKETLDTHYSDARQATASRQQQQALSDEKFTQICEQTMSLATETKESRQLLAEQVEEQRRLRDTLDSFNIRERLAEAARLQQRALTSEIEDFQQQRADMLRVLAEQAEASNNFRNELQQLGRLLGELSPKLEQGNEEIRTQISELMIHLAADAKESHKLLAMQINEQQKLRDSLDLRVKSSS